MTFQLNNFISAFIIVIFLIIMCTLMLCSLEHDLYKTISMTSLIVRD